MTNTDETRGVPGSVFKVRQRHSKQCNEWFYNLRRLARSQRQDGGGYGRLGPGGGDPTPPKRWRGALRADTRPPKPWRRGTASGSKRWRGALRADTRSPEHWRGASTLAGVGLVQTLHIFRKDDPCPHYPASSFAPRSTGFAGKLAASCRLCYHRVFEGTRAKPPRPGSKAGAEVCTRSSNRRSTFLANPFHELGSPRRRAPGADQREGCTR